MHVFTVPDHASDLTELPDEIWNEIGRCLPMEDLVRLTRVNQALHELFKDQIFAPEFDFALLPDGVWEAITENLSQKELADLTALNRQLRYQYSGGVTVQTQDELEEALSLEDVWFIVIEGAGLTMSAHQVQNAPVIAMNDLHVSLGHVHAVADVSITATGQACVHAGGIARVTARQQAFIIATDQAQVTAYDQVYVSARGQAQVATNDGAHVTYH
ncbi:F-box protein [Streptomyces erythrochromogenes]|uniref:F-box protein n=1 Tax=Streptomyces erythrochromogenes TaxID=285574 RepID=UPI0034288651